MEGQVMRNDDEDNSRSSSHRFNGHQSTNQNDNIKYLSKIHYKDFVLQLPPVDMTPTFQYEFMKKQLGRCLSSKEYDAANKFICDLLNF